MTKLQKIAVISRYIGECNSLNNTTVKTIDAIILNLEDDKCLTGEYTGKAKFITDMKDWYGEDFSGLEKVSNEVLTKLHDFFKRVD